MRTFKHLTGDRYEATKKKRREGGLLTPSELIVAYFDKDKKAIRRHFAARARVAKFEAKAVQS